MLPDQCSQGLRIFCHHHLQTAFARIIHAGPPSEHLCQPDALLHGRALLAACIGVYGLQVKQQVQDFKEREAQTAQAEQLAVFYTDREAALASREQSVAALEDSAQKANVAAEYARNEADAMWNKQKVCQ